MSRIVELVIPKVPTTLKGLEEQLVSFGGKQMATEPRVFLFDGKIELKLRPTAPHILSRVAEKLLANVESLVLDEALLIEWAAGRLNVSEAVALKTLFENMQLPFAVAVEIGFGEGVRMLSSPASLAFDVLDAIVRSETTSDLTIVLFETG